MYLLCGGTSTIAHYDEKSAEVTSSRSASRPESQSKDDNGERTNNNTGYVPNPRCSLSQTGLSGPGSWAGPGTGRGSAHDKEVVVFM